MPLPAVEELPKTTRMTLLSDQFISEEGGRLLAGTVVLVDTKTAQRWRDKKIAVDSAVTDKTLYEQKRARMEELQAEIDALEAAAAADRDRPAPEAPPHRGPGRPRLTGV